MARMAYLRKPDGQKRGKPTIPRVMKQKYQMPTFPTFIPSPGEDRTTHDGFINALHQECKSVHPRKQVCYHKGCPCTRIYNFTYN